MSERALAVASDLTAAPEAGPSVGEDFRMIGYLLPSLPHETVRQFHEALGARLALPPAAWSRRERLVVLLDFLRVQSRPPTASEYRELAQRHAEGGEPAVPISTLEGFYGSYADAVDAAVKLHLRGTAARVQSGKRGNRPPRYWTVDKCLRAVETCRDQLGHWPSEFEFAALRRAGQKLCAAHGWSELELPWPKTIGRLFGSYGEMRLAAQRAESQRREELKAHPSSTSPRPEDRPQSRKGRTVRRRPRSKNITI